MKVPSIKKAVWLYKARQKAQRHQERWAHLMSSGYTVRNVKPLNMEPCDTLAIVTDDGLFEERQGGKVVARGVTQGWIDSNQWGGTRL